MVHDFSFNMFINLHNIHKNKHIQSYFFKLAHMETGTRVEKRQTLWPLSMNLIAKSSLETLSRTSLATPKLPDPISFTISYLSIVCYTTTTTKLLLCFCLCSLLYKSALFRDKGRDEASKHTCVCVYIYKREVESRQSSSVLVQKS